MLWKDERTTHVIHDMSPQTWQAMRVEAVSRRVTMPQLIQDMWRYYLLAPSEIKAAGSPTEGVRR